MSDDDSELPLPQLAVKVALEVAESEHGEAGPNVARVLAAEVRRLQEADAKVAALLDQLEALERRQVDSDRLRERVAELGDAARAFADAYGARLYPGPLEQRLRAALGDAP